MRCQTYFCSANWICCGVFGRCLFEENTPVAMFTVQGTEA